MLSLAAGAKALALLAKRDVRMVYVTAWRENFILCISLLLFCCCFVGAVFGLMRATVGLTDGVRRTCKWCDVMEGSVAVLLMYVC